MTKDFLEQTETESSIDENAKISTTLTYDPLEGGTYIVKHEEEGYEKSVRFDAKEEAYAFYTESVEEADEAIKKNDEEILDSCIEDKDTFKKYSINSDDNYVINLIEHYLDKTYPDLFKNDNLRYNNYLQCSYSYAFNDRNDDTLIVHIKKAIKEIDKKMDLDKYYIEKA